MGKRGVKSIIERLDKRLVDVINDMLRDGHTIDEMVAKLQELGVKVSRSAMGRYSKRANEQLQKLKEATEVARFFGDELRKSPDSDISHMLQDQLRISVFNQLMHINDNDDKANTEELMFLSTTIKNLAAATKATIDIAQLRKKIQAEAKATAKEFESQARKSDMPETVIQNTMARILGIAETGG